MFHHLTVVQSATPTIVADGPWSGRLCFAEQRFDRLGFGR
jgi:hypothetical protein